MKQYAIYLFLYCILACIPSGFAADPLNEWTFVMDPAGKTLSEAANTGTETAQFAPGGTGILETDGLGGLLGTGNAPSNGMWTSGSILDAAITRPSSGVQYLRYDFRYDLSDVRNDCGTVLGISFMDETGTNIAGVFFHDNNSTASPDGLTETQITGGLARTGTVSVIMQIDTGAGKMSAWYDLTGSNSFSETNPSLNNVSVKLTSIDKLRFQATGDFRPVKSSINQATVDNIRTASTWDEITAPLAVTRLFMSPLFQDHMVLQRNMNAPVWGRAAPGAVVTVRLDDAIVGTAVADSSGKWLARIGSHANDGGLSHVLVISAPNERSIQINDVVFGDVYIASGQSNMYRLMKDGILAYNEEVAAADYPLIRVLQVALTATNTPQADPVLSSAWTQCSPSTVSGYSAAGYFFARDVYRITGVPVGLLSCAWGGQKIDRFLDPAGVASIPEMAGLEQYQEQGGVNNLYDIYNAMIAPLIPYGMLGAIWYQGEANSSEADFYCYKMQALVRGWRQAWGLGNFPFYYVQLSTWTAGVDWPGLRSAQLRFLSETNTGMAVTIDTGDADPTNIHPHDKQDVGYRLAQWTLAKDFGRNIVYSGPLFNRAVQEGSRMRVLFDYADGGLITGIKDGTNPVVSVSGSLENFEIAGADKVFTNASAVIDADTVIVSNPAVASPMYVRYCYANVPSGSNLLYNTAGLPASPFYMNKAYRLDVISGSGSSTNLVPGTQQTITANTPASGKVFDRWIGAAAEINNPNSSTATVTMPDHALYLLATYRSSTNPVYTLTVHGGYGGGTSQAGSILNIDAAAPATGQIFDHWTGDTQDVVNIDVSSTTLRMPTNNVSVTAVYRVVDSVGDGIPDAWRAMYFGGDGTSTNSNSAAEADPDHDGMNNLQEYLAGTDPVSSRSVLKIEPLSISASGIQTGFRSATGHRYRFETTDDLKTAAWSPLLYNITGDGTLKTLMLNRDDSPSCFYRIKTTSP